MRAQLAALETALALWAGRDDTLPQPEVRRAASTAVGAIDALLRELHEVRRQLVSEIRVSDDAAAVRADALVARLRQERTGRSANPDEPPCGCPVANGLVLHARATCTDPVVARLGWCFDGQERQS